MKKVTWRSKAPLGAAILLALCAIWAGDKIEGAKFGMTALLFGGLGFIVLMVEADI